VGHSIFCTYQYRSLAERATGKGPKPPQSGYQGKGDQDGAGNAAKGSVAQGIRDVLTPGWLPSFLEFGAVAMIGWFVTGFALIGSRRTDTINRIWRIPAKQTAGFSLAICATIAASLVGRWWWGPAILLAAPNIAAAAIMGCTPRSV
jgi:hypothetical protein